MTSFSIQKRMLLMAFIVIVVFLSITASALKIAYRESLYTAKENYLTSQVYSLLAAAELEQGVLYLPEFVAEPNLNEISSDLVAYVYADANAVSGLGSGLGTVWQSASSVTHNFIAAQEIQTPGEMVFILNEEYASAQIKTIWEDEHNREISYIFQVSQNSSSLQDEINAFEGLLWKGLGGAALVLMLGIYGALKLGLKPLQYLAKEVKDIEQGEKHNLDSVYPEELKSVASNLNHLIDVESQQRERYRNTLADLAHSLKTPLAVLKNKASLTNDSELDDAVQRMDDIITHQLKRATKSYQKQSYQGVGFGVCIDRILPPLKKIYPHHCNINTMVDGEVQFYGDEGDLLEVLGNCIENAFKYNDGEIYIEVKALKDNGAKLLIKNTCLPLSSEALQRLQQRGKRADTSTTGQGIGLAVVSDIVAAYGGKLLIDQAEIENQDWFSLEIQF